MKLAHIIIMHLPTRTGDDVLSYINMNPQQVIHYNNALSKNNNIF